MSFSETVFLFVLALIVFGPKKLPEIARQAGRLLAELRRASNEFKSQIETEIAHLEVEKKQQAILNPRIAPQGTVASLNLNPSSESMALPSRATLAAPAEAVLAGDVAPADLAVANVIAENSKAGDAPPLDVPQTEPALPAQDSHV